MAPPADDSHGSSIQVCVRVRPFTAREKGETCCVQMPTNSQLVLCEPERTHKTDFEFDRCYWSHNREDSQYADQQTIMDELGLKVVRCAHEGYNTCFFAYGQTGSGKTWSVLGSQDVPQNRGLMPRVLEQLFADIDGAPSEFSFTCKASYLEVYNEILRDLLLPATEQQKKLEVRHHPKIGVYVPGALDVPVACYKEVAQLIDYGSKSRSVGATNMNQGSSRSHCIFTFTMEKEGMQNDRQVHLSAQINLVDLAGSERQKKTEAQGQRLKEGAMINQSLTTLAMVINKLAEASTAGKSVKGDFIPFRNSKLTHLLQESLAGNSRTFLIAALSPAASNYEETLSTVRFAKTCKTIVTKAKKNEESRGDVIADLKAEIEMLKRQSVVDPHLEEKMAENAAILARLQQDRQVLLEQAAQHAEKRTRVLQDMGLQTTGIEETLQMDPNTPRLINISDDPALSGCLCFYLLDGADSTLGSDKNAKIKLNGLGIKAYMCCLKNVGHKEVTLSLLTPAGKPITKTQEDAEGMLYKPMTSLKSVRTSILSTPGQLAVANKRASGVARASGIAMTSVKSVNDVLDEKPGRVLVNGRHPEPHREMKHGDRIIFGHAFALRLVIPLKAHDDDDALHLADALIEVVHEDPDAMADCRSMLQNLEDQIGEQKVQEFLSKFSEVLPLIEEANLISHEMRPQDNLLFQVEVVSQLISFSTAQPQLVVRLYQDCQVVDVFELPQFIQRLGCMRLSYDEYKHHPDIAASWDIGEDPWASYTYREVTQVIEQAKQARQEKMEKLRKQLALRNKRIELLEEEASRANAKASANRVDPLAQLNEHERRLRMEEANRQKRNRDQHGFLGDDHLDMDGDTHTHSKRRTSGGIVARLGRRALRQDNKEKDSSYQPARRARSQPASCRILKCPGGWRPAGPVEPKPVL
eukprot:TRINITY_DN44644_c0_g1_i1.p1 TRINITY_DN44644_c0_g1~~TRINITY_DN44644_c0_g1_i1.p1  ORF type:complete len:924 (+),score=248.62 TRINITY_DN44644_c0_g1_i1:61-2832(+)